MRKVCFHAFGHENIVGTHKTTLELTTEDYLTSHGDCIVGVRCNQTLQALDAELKALAQSRGTKIVLRLSAGGLEEKIVGRGSPGLIYSDSVSMVARKSQYECGRTVMIDADKSASDLSRIFTSKLQNPVTILNCELMFLRK